MFNWEYQAKKNELTTETQARRSAESVTFRSDRLRASVPPW